MADYGERLKYGEFDEFARDVKEAAFECVEAYRKIAVIEQRIADLTGQDDITIRLKRFTLFQDLEELLVDFQDKQILLETAIRETAEKMA